MTCDMQTNIMRHDNRRRGLCSRRCFISLVIVPLLMLICVPLHMYLTYGQQNVVMSHPVEDEKHIDTLVPPSAEFLRRQKPVIRDEFAYMYSFPDGFLNELRVLVDKAPVNKATGNKQVMFTMFNFQHLDLAKNLYCSSISAGVPANFHIFITLDKHSFTKMKDFVTDRQVLHLDISDRRYTYEQFCKVKLFMQYQLLLWSVESTICDDDLVIIKNPLDGLFEMNTSHFEVSTEGVIFDFNMNYNFDEFNVGFMRAIPTETTIRLYKKWLIKAVPDKELDQKVLHAMLLPVRRHDGVNRYQSYDLRRITGISEKLVIRFYDPLDVVHGGVFHMSMAACNAAAQQRGIESPYVVHLAWIQPIDKKSVFSQHQLWFYHNLKCEVAPGASFPGWKR